jgi:Rrf2 family protein
MKITSYTDYSLRVLIYLALNRERSTIREIAEVYGISRNHLMKVVHQLQQKGYVDTVRGKQGGMSLARDAGDISIGAVVRDMEPDTALVECFDPDGRCAITPHCHLKSVLSQAVEAFMATLDRYSLADIARHDAAGLREDLGPSESGLSRWPVGHATPCFCRELRIKLRTPSRLRRRFMAVYKAPLRDMRFVLNDVFGAGDLWASLPGTAEVTPDLADAILEEAAKTTEGLLFPLNRDGDEEGCQWSDGEVTTPKGFQDAYKTFAENGWTALTGNPDFGGQGMPKSLSVVFEEMLHASNTSFALYPILTNGACLCLDAHASDELKHQYLPKLYSGEWAGTMCLTEPHCGTDLGILRTKAEPNDDDSYSLTGTKIFITGGEHDLTDNIIHLVLAKLPDAPAGTKGISLFLVPKYLPDADGNAGERNGVQCGSIEHKMGIKGSATCVLNFDGAKGWLVGEPNKGLAAMFTMMNYERLSIGLQGLGLGEVSYQSAVDYALDRRQGRAADGVKDPEENADPLIVHGDIRRMLLTMRAWNEGGRALASYVGMQLDIAKFSDDDEARKKAEERVALLTPVAKAFFTDRGLDTCIIGQQVFGGHGYIREWGMEQFVRDARIAQIYEGTNGIQALDLVGRKLARNGGKFAEDFIADMRAWLKDHEGDSGVKDVAGDLKGAIDLLEQACQDLLSQAGNDANALNAAAVEFTDLFGLVTYAWLWARMMSVAGEKSGDAAFFDAKLATGRFYFQRLLPRAQSLVAQIGSGSDVMMSVDADLFAVQP